jgi:hypothetical protein
LTGADFLFTPAIADFADVAVGIAAEITARSESSTEFFSVIRNFALRR